VSGLEITRRTFVAALGGAVGGVFEGYGAMLSGAVGDPGRIFVAIQSGNANDIANAIRPLTETLDSATPFIFVALGLAVSFHAGLFNLGADGQFLIGGFGVGIAATLMGPLPPLVVLVGSLAGGALFGAAYGFVPGFLKARTGAHEVITTLMLNSITPAVPTLIFLVLSAVDLGRLGPMSLPEVPLLFDLRAIRVDWGFVVAVLMAPVVSFLLFRTTLGFELRATGQSESAAVASGVNVKRMVLYAMVMSGAVAGLIGMPNLFGVAHSYGSTIQTGIGFVGIAVALLGRNHPVGIAFGALVFAWLTEQSNPLGILAGISPDVILITQGVVVLSVVIAYEIVRRYRQRLEQGAVADALAKTDTAEEARA